MYLTQLMKGGPGLPLIRMKSVHVFNTSEQHMVRLSLLAHLSIRPRCDQDQG